MDESIKQQHMDVLRNKEEDLVKRLKAAVKLELDYWEEKKNPPNLQESAFKMILNNIPGTYKHKYEVRKSEQGKYGKTGEKSVFYIWFKVPIGRTLHEYMIKGFFFEENDLKGVCIQSFRLQRKVDRRKLRII